MATEPNTRDAAQADDPRQRPIEPDHPMVLDGQAVRGDAELMLRCMIEELLTMGTSAQQLRAMLGNAQYHALHMAKSVLGPQRAAEILEQTIARVGQFRYRTIEHSGSVQPATLTVHQT